MKVISLFLTLATVSLALSTPAYSLETDKDYNIEEEIEADALKELSDEAELVSPSSFNISGETILALQNKRALIKTWAALCPDGTQSHGECPFGDMTIFSGMGCLAGDKDRCEDVRKAQGPDGRWWRSPGLVDIEKPDSFSRDQARGALAYLVATKDVEAAKRWQAYIESNNGKMCNIANKTNNRCTITPGSSRLFRAVWLYLGLTPAKWMKKTQWWAPIYDPIEAMLQPDNFPMHLSALYSWIRIEIERRGGPATDKVDKKVIKIITRREPGNPYFKMLRDGPTQEVADLILQKCPDVKPAAELTDWAWQRSQKLKKGQTEYVWQHASGHDCIFIINMFERELALRNTKKLN